MDRQRRGRAPSCRAPARPAGRRHHRRRGGGHRLPAQHHDPLSVHLVHGGFGLSGARRVHHGPRDAPHRPARQIVHPADHGLRLQCPGHHGLPDDREPKQQADNHTHNPLHVMQCPNTDLPPARRDVLRRRRQSGDDRALCAGSRAGRRHGTPDAALHVPGGRNALRHGTAALPPADMEDDAHPHVGQMRAIPAQDGRHDPDRFDGRMVPELLPPQRRGRHDGPLRELLPRASGAKLCADFQSAGAELEGGRGTAVGCPGQGDRRQHARRALSRRRGGGKRPRCRHDGDRHGIGRKDRDREPAGRQHRHYRRGGRTDGDPHCGKH